MRIMQTRLKINESFKSIRYYLRSKIKSYSDCILLRLWFCSQSWNSSWKKGFLTLWCLDK